MKRFRILIVDDEEDICEILAFNLKNAGYEVDTVNSAEEALFKMRNKYDLLLLDIMMEGISGLRFAQLLREEYENTTPIIFISALDTEPDILDGFSKGGDDYISKPFSIKEVLARVKAVLARYSKSSDDLKRGVSDSDGEKMSYRLKGLFVDFDNKRVFIDNTEIVLTKKENEILILLTQNAGKIFSRDEILKDVWQDESYVLERTVDVHIARLRKKLGEYGELIINRSGYGYCFNPDALQN